MPFMAPVDYWKRRIPLEDGLQAGGIGLRGAREPGVVDLLFASAFLGMWRRGNRRDGAWEATFDAESDKAVANGSASLELTVIGGPPEIGHRLDHAVRRMRERGYRLTRVVPGRVDDAWTAHFERRR